MISVGRVALILDLSSLKFDRNVSDETVALIVSIVVEASNNYKKLIQHCLLLSYIAI